MSLLNSKQNYVNHTKKAFHSFLESLYNSHTQLGFAGINEGLAFFLKQLGAGYFK